MKVGLQSRGCEFRERCSTRFTLEVSLGRRLDVGLTVSIAHFWEEEMTLIRVSRHGGRHLSCMSLCSRSLGANGRTGP